MNLILLMALLACVPKAHSQQAYVDNKQLDCYNHYNSTDGNICNGAPSCVSYLTFRSTPTYNTPISIAYLLNSDPSQIASINEVLDVQTIPGNTQIIVPVNCSCSGQYYQHNSSYVLNFHNDTYFTIANLTYQGLTTCQALMAQNKFDDRNLTVGIRMHVPLRCACPTPNQRAAGFNYLLSYMVTWGDNIPYIADLFGIADQQSIFLANDLSNSSTIYPFTPILVPLKNPPSKIQLPISPPPPSPPPPESVQNGKSHSSRKWVVVGSSLGAALLVLLALLVFLICFFCPRTSKSPSAPSPTHDTTAKEQHNSDGLLFYSASNKSSLGIKEAIDSLTVYNFEDLERATGFFSEAERIKGCVYRATIDGDVAAVKALKGGDISEREIGILKRINHINIIRLSGFCIHSGNTYLVYEYAENGALDDWLNLQYFKTQPSSSTILTWKQRAQIACDVADALTYLHNYSSPPHIHKNLKTSNILLDGNLRAKISNFAVAREVNVDQDQDEGERGVQMTRHVFGTYGYMAPEYIENGIISPKLDVYAFGIVLLELLSGREAVEGEKDGGEQLLSATICEVLEGDNVRGKLRGFMDPNLRHEYPLDLAFTMAQLAKCCVATNLSSRPTMPEVFITLTKILSSSVDWDPSDELDCSGSIGTKHLMI